MDVRQDVAGTFRTLKLTSTYAVALFPLLKIVYLRQDPRWRCVNPCRCEQHTKKGPQFTGEQVYSS